MLRNVLLKSLRDARRALMWWSIGLILLALMMMAFYPSIRESAEELEGYVEALSPEVMALFAGEFTDITSPEGFLNSQLYFLMLPMLFLIFAISYGSGATAGEEDKGTLDLLLANPVTRAQVVLEKFAAMVLAALVLAVAFWAALAIGADIGRYGNRPGKARRSHFQRNAAGLDVRDAGSRRRIRERQPRAEHRHLERGRHLELFSERVGPDFGGHRTL